MAWIVNRKAYDMVLKSWVMNCLKMYMRADKVSKFIKESMKIGEWNWQQEEKASGMSTIS